MVLVLLVLLVLLLRRARGLRWATNAEATIKLCIIGEEGSAARTTITVRAVAAHTIPGYFLKKPPFPERAAACKWIRVSRGASESERVEPRLAASNNDRRFEAAKKSMMYPTCA